MGKAPLLRVNECGLYCEAGDFHIDPWKPVDRAVISHAHSDHARWGSKEYLAAAEGARVLRTRLGPEASLSFAEYGERRSFNGVTVSLHPAGHILGSAQVRVEHRGEVWVFTGDYKTEPDATCSPFELVRCHTFITECTFGLPIYRWRPQSEVFEEINAWWRGNKAAGKASVLFAYALGKAQRLLAGLDASIGPIFVHGAVARLTDDYRSSGIALPVTQRVGEVPRKHGFGGALILGPPSSQGTPWMRRFGVVSTGFASGWMQLRGTRRRRAMDRGFVLSDHVDWPNLNRVIRETGAEKVYATHGNAGALVRWLGEQGMEAAALQTRYEGETDDAPENTEGGDE